MKEQLISFKTAKLAMVGIAYLIYNYGDTVLF